MKKYHKSCHNCGFIRLTRRRKCPHCKFPLVNIEKQLTAELRAKKRIQRNDAKLRAEERARQRTIKLHTNKNLKREAAKLRIKNRIAKLRIKEKERRHVAKLRAKEGAQRHKIKLRADRKLKREATKLRVKNRIIKLRTRERERKHVAKLRQQELQSYNKQRMECISKQKDDRYQTYRIQEQLRAMIGLYCPACGSDLIKRGEEVSCARSTHRSWYCLKCKTHFTRKGIVPTMDKLLVYARNLYDKGHSISEVSILCSKHFHIIVYTDRSMRRLLGIKQAKEYEAPIATIEKYASTITGDYKHDVIQDAIIKCLEIKATDEAVPNIVSEIFKKYRNQQIQKQYQEISLFKQISPDSDTELWEMIDNSQSKCY